jgi:endonuclease/exonuclease/phosphatase family metal-dependent hydrolase
MPPVSIPFWTKVGHVTSGLAEKIRYLFSYDHAHRILPPPLQADGTPEPGTGIPGLTYNNERATELHVLSYNINCLFFHHDNEQIIGVTEFFQELFNEENYIDLPDIICLQEAWEEVIVNKIISMAHKAGWYAAQPATVKRLFIGEHTGLLMLSRYPIIAHEQTIYEDRIGSDWLANKGAQYATIEVPTPTPHHVHIVNTHLNASGTVSGGKSEFGNVARKQLLQLLKYLPHQFHSSQTLLVGDLNLIPDEVSDFIETTSESHGTCALTSTGVIDKYISFPEEDWQLDYVLGFLPQLRLEKNSATAAQWCGFWGETKTELMSHVTCSDHLPIRVQLRWQQQTQTQTQTQTQMQVSREDKNKGKGNYMDTDTDTGSPRSVAATASRVNSATEEV